MQLGQPHPGFATRSVAPVESGWTSVTTVTCDMSRMLMLFVLVWLTTQSGWSFIIERSVAWRHGVWLSIENYCRISVFVQVAFHATTTTSTTTTTCSQWRIEHFIKGDGGKGRPPKARGQGAIGIEGWVRKGVSPPSWDVPPLQKNSPFQKIFQFSEWKWRILVQSGAPFLKVKMPARKGLKVTFAFTNKMGRHRRMPLKAKFHYASWFEAGSKLVAERFEATFHYALVRSWSATGFEPASNQIA